MASNVTSHTGIAPTARCPHGIGLALFDVDGTILIHGEGIRPRVTDAIRHAHDHGVITAVSSGRPIGMVPEAVRDAGIMDYFVCTNGATVYDASLRPIMDHGMPAAVARSIVWALRPLAPSWNAFVDGRGIAEVRNSTYMVASAVRARGPRRAWQRAMRLDVEMLRGDTGFRHVRDIRPTLEAATTVEKLGCTFANAEDTYDAARLLMDASFEVAIMGSRELEITADGVTKGTGAAWLIDHAGIDASRAVAFGDGGNDAPLASVVGTFVAMGNADDTLKALATCECGTVDDDGVAVWLEAQMSEAACARKVARDCRAQAVRPTSLRQPDERGSRTERTSTDAGSGCVTETTNQQA